MLKTLPNYSANKNPPEWVQEKYCLCNKGATQNSLMAGAEINILQSITVLLSKMPRTKQGRIRIQ